MFTSKAPFSDKITITMVKVSIKPQKQEIGTIIPFIEQAKKKDLATLTKRLSE